MGFTRRQLETLIDEIPRNISLDEADATILKRWRNDERAIDALRDILARAEKANGTINVSDVVEFIQYVLTLKRYAEKSDRNFAELANLSREKKRRLPKTRSLLTKAIRKRRITPEAAAKIMTDLDHIDISPPPLPVRSSKSGSRIRTLFMTQLSATVREEGGLWMDAQVAAIASVTLDSEIDAEQARNARRS